MNRFFDVSNSLWTCSKTNGTNISYIMSYMTCEYKHNAIKPLIPDQNINLEVLDSHAHINSSTTKVRPFIT
jgi:hypothetical protein